MAWKPKEKQLTPEEAVEHARRELAPYWLGTDPLLAGLRGADGKATAHPLDKAFDKKAWLIYFADLTSFDGETLLQYAREWVRRYSGYELGQLLVVRKSYSFLSSAKSLQGIFRKPPDAFPVAIDSDGLLTEAFGGGKAVYPAVKLLHQRKVVFDHSGPEWFRGLEKEMQQFLRLKDPGLPLAPPFEPAGSYPHDVSTAELGAGVRSSIFKFTGKIAQEQERVVAQDPSATIRFTSSASRVSIVAQSVSSTEEPSRVRVELNGDTVYDAVAAADLSFGDDGGSEIKVRQGRLHHALHSLPIDKGREITLRFLDADRLPVAIYGARFSNK